MIKSDKHYLTPLNDEYATCERTKAVLRIHCGDATPASITATLNIEPSETVEVGVRGKRQGDNAGPIGKVNLWMLDSENNVQSRDLRRHIDWLLDKLEPAGPQIRSLQNAGIVIDVWCVWWSKTGQGGPTLWPKQMHRMASLDLEFSVDFAYFGED